MAITSPGIGSGLDVNGIIAKLMQVEQQPLINLATKEASYQSKISAFGALQGAVSSLNTALAGLVPTKAAIATTTATIGNTAAAFVTANASAQTGSHDLEINQLAAAHKVASVAQSHKLASGQYASAFSSIAQGTLNLSVGGGAIVPITINAGNATLTGLKNAINAASAGVTADIVPDGGSVRLVITSNAIGSAGKITTSGLTNFDFNGTTGSLSQDTAAGGRPASGFNSATESIATGTLNIQLGNGTAKQVVINTGNNTLSGLRDAINNAGAGITAELVTVSSNNIRLVLSSNNTGASNVITTSGLSGFDFDGTSGTGSLSQASSNGGQSAQDAIIKVNGTTSNYSSNTISTAIANVTLRLTAATSVATKLTIARNEGLSFAEQASAKFRTTKGTVGDSAAASVAATTAAVPGSYAFQVMQLATTHRITTPAAQAHQISTVPPKPQALQSATFASTSTDVTDGINDGTLNFALGHGGTFSVDVAAGTTLDGLKTLINNDADNLGVTASIVADGVNQRLVLTSNVSGTAGEMTVTNTGGLSGFDYDSGSDSGSLSESQTAQGFSSSAETIAQGTLSIALGDGTTKNIVIDGTNNTLSGLRDAINVAGAGVTASIVTEGLGVKLVLKSNAVGHAGAMTLSGLSGFEFNTTTQNLSEATADGGQAAQGFTSANAAISQGILKLSIGNGTEREITIDSSNNTLEGIKNTINSGGYGVTASLITVGTSDVRLVLNSNTVGTAGQIKLSGIEALSFDPGTGTGAFSQATADGGQAAQGSIIKLNGVSISSASNIVTDALQGVTLNLTAVSNSQTTLTISQEKTSGLNGAISSIVKAFNELNKSLHELGKYDSAAKSGGPLLGNATLRHVSTSIKAAFQAVPPGLGSNTIKRLSDIGIETEQDGSLSFDATKLTSATGKDYDAVALLAASFGKATKTLTDNMLGTKGSITSASDGLNTSVERLNDQREVLARRLTQIEARYKRQFSALDTLLASMNSTSSYLQQQLSNLPGASSSK